MTKLAQVIIFDIDGCLSDDGHRKHLLPRHANSASKDGFTAHEEFDAYHTQAPYDRPIPIGEAVFNQAVIDLVQKSYVDLAEPMVYFFTARPEQYRGNTVAWLNAYLKVDWKNPAYNGHLIMREPGDNDPSPVVKYKMLIGMITYLHSKGYDVIVKKAYDDRDDVLSMYSANNIQAIYLGGQGGYEVHGIKEPRRYNSPFSDNCGTVKFELVEHDDNPNPYVVQEPLSEHNTEPSSMPASPVGPTELAEIAAIFDTMADTLRSRAADYGYNAAKVAKVMQIFFPDGVKLDSEEDHEAWHLFELIIVKLTRFVNSGLRHQDSIHDMAIYAGFVERLVAKHNIQIGK